MTLNVKIIEETFKIIKPRITEFSVTFYQNLFIDYPETVPLFANTDMEKQQEKLSQSLRLVVLNIGYPERLNDILKPLGARHANSYGTLKEHYPIVGSVLLKTLKFYLKENWNDEVEKAWTDAYASIVSLMLEGANSEDNSPSNYSETLPVEKEVNLHQESVINELTREKSGFNIRYTLLILGLALFILVTCFAIYHNSSKDNKKQFKSFNYITELEPFV